MKIVIGRDNCVWCDKATALLDKTGTPYVYVSVHDPHWLDLMKRMGLKTVPQVFDLVGGYKELKEKTNDVS